MDWIDSIMSLVGIGFLVFFLLSVGGIIFLIVWVLKKSLKPKSKEFIENEKKAMFEKVASMKAQLEPWEGHSYRDITSAMVFISKKTLSNTLTGTIYSPHQQPLIAFDRVERGMAANGYMFASSTGFDLFYDIRVDEFTIVLNNTLLGEIDKSGNIKDAKGRIIGHAKHPVKVSLTSGFVKYRFGDNTFPLTMNGRLLANIRVAPNYSDIESSSLSVIFNEHNYGQPILDMRDKPTQEEEQWLLALAILETAFHGHWLI